jgi:hypothetical protein
MPSLPVLDVVMGLSFVYLLLALLCATIIEMTASLTRRRARFLDAALLRILGDQGLKDEFYRHPLIQSLNPRSDDDRVRPSYIPAEHFALAVRDLLAGPGRPAHDLAAMRERMPAQGGTAFQQTVKLMMDEARDKDSPDELDLGLRRMFDAAMDRTSGWYKRNSQGWAMALAAVVTVVMNADTVRMTHLLWTNPTLRASLVRAAEARLPEETPVDLLPMVVYTDGDAPERGIPVGLELSEEERVLLARLTGWEDDWRDLARRVRDTQAVKVSAQSAGAATAVPPPALSFGERTALGFRWLGRLLWEHALGWAVTALAVSMCAPMWFDTLKKFMNVRNAGPRPDAKKEARP